MYAERPQTTWTAGTLSATLHIALIAAAVSATGTSAPPPRAMPTPIHWDIAVPQPVQHSAPIGTGTGVGSAPLAPAPLKFDGGIPDPVNLPSLQPGTSRVRLSGTSGVPVTADLPLLGLPEVESHAPEVIYLPIPEYPARAPMRQHGTGDSVVVEYLITPAGYVDPGEIKVLSSTHQVFVEAVRNALKEARFRPAIGPAGPVPALARQVFRFIRR